MTAEERSAAVAASDNPEILQLARMWQAVEAQLHVDGPALSGWLSLARERAKNGSWVRVLHLKGRREIAKDWRVPTLLLDATLNMDLVRPYWPQVELTAELFAEAPHQHIRQVVDRAYSKSMLDPVDVVTAATDPRLKRLIDNDPGAPDRIRRNLQRLRAILCRESRRYAPERVLVVCQKRVKDALRSLGPLPANVELAHHNAVAGRDEWGPQPDRAGIRCLIVVGRTMPPVYAVKQRAEALTGIAIENTAGDRFERGDAVRERLDGKLEAAEAEHHPDPIAEAIRWQICEAELIQIIGRGRGVNRTAANPLDVLVMTDVPLPLAVAGTLASAELDPSPDDDMAGCGGVVLRNARHAACAYPDLWPTHEAARKALQRSGTSLIRYISHRDECPTPPLVGIVGHRVRYQLAGAGQKEAEAWFDPELVDDIESWLQERLGQVAWCQMDEAPDLAAAAARLPCQGVPTPEAQTQPAISLREATELAPVAPLSMPRRPGSIRTSSAVIKQRRPDSHSQMFPTTMGRNRTQDFHPVGAAFGQVGPEPVHPSVQ